MQLDELLEAAQRDRAQLEALKADTLKQIEDFRATKLGTLKDLDEQMKRIDRVLRAAGASPNGQRQGERRAPRRAPGEEGYKYRQVGVERLQAFADCAAKMEGQFTRQELQAKVATASEGQATYAVRDLTALGWIKQIPDPSRKGRFFMEWVGPDKPEVEPLTEPRSFKTVTPNGNEITRIAGWRFKDAELRKRAGMEED